MSKGMCEIIQSLKKKKDQPNEHFRSLWKKGMRKSTLWTSMLRKTRKFL